MYVDPNALAPMWSNQANADPGIDAWLREQFIKQELQRTKERPIKITGDRAPVKVEDATPSGWTYHGAPLPGSATGYVLGPHQPINYDAVIARAVADPNWKPTPASAREMSMSPSADPNWKPTLAPPREKPPTYTSREMDKGGINQPAGAYTELGPDKWVNQRYLGALAASGDLDAALHLMRQNEDRARRQAAIDRATPEQIAAAGQAARAEVGNLLAFADKVFGSNTKRAEEAIKEYGVKVRGPERDVVDMALEELRGLNDRAKAGIARRMASQQFVTDTLRGIADKGGKLTAKDVERIIDQANALDEAFGGSGGASGGGAAAGTSPDTPALEAFRRRFGLAPPATGAAPPATGAAPPAGAPAGGARRETPAEKIARTMGESQATLDTDILISRALGRTPQSPIGGFDPERIASALGSSGLAPTTEQMDKLASEIRKGGYGSADKIVSDLMRHYVRLSRRAGKWGGAGGFKIAQKPNLLTNRLVISDPSLGQIQLDEPGNLALPTISQWFSGTRDLIGPITGQGVWQAAQEAKALDAFIKRFLEAGRQKR